MRVYIPTYKRANSQRTFQKFPREWQERTTFVANEEDAVVLRRNWPHGSVLVPPSRVNTIAAKRAWIIDQSTEDSLVMFDDDLTFDYRKDPDDWHLLVAPPNIVGYYLGYLEKVLRDYVHAGFGPRQGNNRKKDMFEANTRMMYVLGYQPAVLREHCELGRIDTREDFDYTLQLLKKGFPNRVLNEIAAGQSYNNPGGCSEDRTMEASNADAEKLASLHPGFVRVTEKKYKQSINRKEVVVQWKKAFASAGA